MFLQNHSLLFHRHLNLCMYLFLLAVLINTYDPFLISQINAAYSSIFFILRNVWNHNLNHEYTAAKN